MTKNAFSLTTSKVNASAGLPKRWSERHVKNITSLEKYIFNFSFLCFSVLEKFSVFSDHLTTFCLKPSDSKP